MQHMALRNDDKSSNKEVANAADEESGHSTVDVPSEITDFVQPGNVADKQSGDSTVVDVPSEIKDFVQPGNVADEPSGHSTVHIPSEITDFGRPGTLHRVPAQLRENKEHLFAPAVLPLGPYHHDDHRFGQAEQLKNEVLNIKLRDKNDRDSTRGEFLKRAQEIRSFYGVLGGYDDKALAEMMLRDACFVVYFMEALDNNEFADHIIRRLGLSGSIFLWRDFYMLENQVPLWAIKLLIRLTLFKGDDHDTRVDERIWKFVRGLDSDPFFEGEVPPLGDGKEKEPLHLLELRRTARIKPRRSNGVNGSRYGIFGKIFKNLKWKSCCRDNETSHTFNISDLDHPARSVMDLKAKGIHVRPSSKCLTDIKFQSNWFFGELLLPTLFINNGTKVFFSNLIAFEMSPEIETGLEVISYVNFMQYLIESPKDVKELREQGVLLSFMNDEHVMNIFKEIDIFGLDTPIFNNVRFDIDRHCQSKAKTWIAELRYTYFRNPWSAIALFSAAILLCLTFLQTIYSKK